LCLILGYDAFLGLPQWHQWLQLGELAHLVIAHRPGWNHAELPADLQTLRQQRLCEVAQLKSRPAGGMVFVEVTQLAISATRIRNEIRAGRDIRYLLPDRVYTLIQEQQLYR
jgi:nicotinate-nucleotide adenylyltransferase